MSFLDRKCLQLLEAINLYHSPVEFSQSISSKRSFHAKAPVVRNYPKGCGRQICTQKDAINNKKANNNVDRTNFNCTKDDEDEMKLSKRNLEQSKNFSFEKCMSTRMDNGLTSNFMKNKSSSSAFPSTLKDLHAIKQIKERQPNAAVFNQMKANKKILDDSKATNNKNSIELHEEVISKVSSSNDVVASILQKNQKNKHTIDEVTNAKLELQKIKKEATEHTLKKKRKIESQYEIMVVPKKSKNNSLVSNSIIGVSVDFESDTNKVSNALQLFRTIYNRNPSYNLAYNEFVEKYGKFNQGVIGKIPGVEIGDEFYFRAEMYIVGLHCQLVAGIDYVKLHGKKIAISIVSSNRQYSNKKCGNDVLMYSGIGGAFEKGQKLVGRNLALKNSIEDKIPIRVIHGRKTSGKRTYVYDGLYVVEKYTIEDCKLTFQLRRILGQAKINIEGLEILPYPPLYDISNGEEDKPIKVVNDIDDERFPAPFTYITKSIYPSSYVTIKPICCDCLDGCSDFVKCACVVKNGGSLPFNSDGALVECRPLVYECGPDCKCPSSCDNRVSQHGIKFQLEVFKTKSHGWGVRPLSFIPSGSFICEYVGEILNEQDAEKRTNDEYLFAIGSNYHDKSRWDDVVSNIPTLQKDACCEVDESGYSIDASNYGNVARFINHSCSPNLVAQELLYDNDDIRVPRIVLFAGEDIQPNQELTYDYNYNVNQVYDTNGYLKKKECHCGSSECIGWLY